LNNEVFCFPSKLDENQERKKTGDFLHKTKRGHKSSASVFFPKNKGFHGKEREKEYNKMKREEKKNAKFRAKKRSLRKPKGKTKNFTLTCFAKHC
jgi:hypothetical protein